MGLSEQKKVLFIDYFFPPLEADWRAIGFAKHMPALGWLPIVLSASETVNYGKDYTTLEGIPPEVKAHRVGHKERSKVSTHARMLLKIAADFPDSYKTWYRPALQMARTILQRERIDLLYSASPTYTTAMIAMTLKRESGIPWVADCLDGWAVNDFLMEHLDQYVLPPFRQILKWRIRSAERAILSEANRVVSIHQHVVDRWKSLHHLSGENMHVITDGYEDELFQGLTPRPISTAKTKIIFLGSYYPAFSETIKTFLSTLYDVDAEAEVIFIGRRVDVIHKMDMPNTMCVMNMSRKKALEYALGGDFLFVVMPPYARWSPTKTYDYLRLGKPILGSVPADGDAARLITDAKAGFILSHDANQLKIQLKDIITRHKNGDFDDFRPVPDQVTRFERRHLAKRMVSVFNDSINKKE